MLDWLRRPAKESPALELAGKQIPVVIRRLPQARRMTMRLAPDGSEVRISIPNWGRTAEALAFARSRSVWLEGQLAALPPPSAPLPGATIKLHGEPLLIRHEASRPRKPRITEGELHIGGPEAGLSARLQRWLEGEARRLMGGDLTHYCAAAGLPAPRLMLSRARRRWGSCANSGTIRINWRLVMAPAHVRRSVVAHEVAHLLHFDHGPGFHAALADLYEGDIAAANRWLKQEGRSLYLPFG